MENTVCANACEVRKKAILLELTEYKLTRPARSICLSSLQDRWLRLLFKVVRILGLSVMSRIIGSGSD